MLTVVYCVVKWHPVTRRAVITWPLEEVIFTDPSFEDVASEEGGDGASAGSADAAEAADEEADENMDPAAAAARAAAGKREEELRGKRQAELAIQGKQKLAEAKRQREADALEARKAGGLFMLTQTLHWPLLDEPSPRVNMSIRREGETCSDLGSSACSQ